MHIKRDRVEVEITNLVSNLESLNVLFHSGTFFFISTLWLYEYIDQRNFELHPVSTYRKGRKWAVQFIFTQCFMRIYMAVARTQESSYREIAELER